MVKYNTSYIITIFGDLFNVRQIKETLNKNNDNENQNVQVVDGPCSVIPFVIVNVDDFLMFVVGK